MERSSMAKRKEVVFGILLMEGVTWPYYDGGGPLWAPGRKVKEGKEPGDVAGDVRVYDGIVLWFITLNDEVMTFLTKISAKWQPTFASFFSSCSRLKINSKKTKSTWPFSANIRGKNHQIPSFFLIRGFLSN